ncbi:MAG TPA: chorismate synthase [Clostridia bacterium]|nr:chorismate synthase [Clostridia bacterium]HOL61049.1 chorismate synthase [Clostridia bacterium]HPO53961.1 chorismate synthase [Clostridia bacterium]
MILETIGGIMSSVWGKNLQISLFGESHGQMVGGTLHNFPAGIPVNMDRIKLALKLRQGSNNFNKARKEEERPKIVSGVTNGVTNGAPITVLFPNKDYNVTEFVKGIPRPSQADYAAEMRYKGAADLNGGGHRSGRVTAPLVFLGTMCADYLASKGIEVVSHIRCIGDIYDEKFGAEIPPLLIERLNSSPLATISPDIRKKMVSLLMGIKATGNSVGGSVETAVVGMPAGFGSPIFDNLESKIASILFAIPAVKAVGFGLGHMFSHALGSDVSDPFVAGPGGEVRTATNYNGGLNGGMTNGMPIIITTDFKPTPSISQPLKTMDFIKNRIVDISIKGDHVACLVPRSNIVVTSAVAVAVLDAYLEGVGYR